MKCCRLVKEHFGSCKYALFGQEAIGSTWALAKMNMFLHGEDNHRIEWGDTIRNPKLLDGDAALKHFDIVVANPPFSLEKWGFEGADKDKFSRFRRAVPPRTKGDYAFILHMIETMKPGSGRMAVVVQHGVVLPSSRSRIWRRRPRLAACDFPQRAWTVDELAREVALSRSVLTKRFAAKGLLGVEANLDRGPIAHDVSRQSDSDPNRLTSRSSGAPTCAARSTRSRACRATPCALEPATRGLDPPCADGRTRRR